jgi:CyaY protein
MAENDFEARTERTLAAIERALEQVALDADFERKEGGVLEIELADGAKIIVNRHAVAQEIWVAARSGGFHFRWDGTAWRDSRDGTELFAALSRLVGAVLKA